MPPTSIRSAWPSTATSLFVLDNNPDRIVEINPTNGQEIASVDVSSFLNFGGSNAGGLRVHPTTGNFWLASSSDGRVAEITPAGALVGTSISLANVGAPTGLDFDNSDNILVSNTWGMVNRYPLGGGIGSAKIPASGDLDGDGTVDGTDFLIWQFGFGRTENAIRSQGDADGDGDVDGADFLVWQSSLESREPPARATPTPTHPS